MQGNVAWFVRLAAVAVGGTIVTATGACRVGSDSASARAASVRNITPREAYDLIQQRQGNPDFVIVDVRTPEEFAEAHIAGAVNICIERCDSSFRDELARLDKKATYLIYCRSGRRRGDAAAVMVGLEFTDVYNMLGGIGQWQAEGLPVVSSG